MSKPPWWRPFARRRWNRKLAEYLGSDLQKQVAKRLTSAVDRSEWMRAKLTERSARRRDAVNRATDLECLEADVFNQVPHWTTQRASRNREGEQ